MLSCSFVAIPLIVPHELSAEEPRLLCSHTAIRVRNPGSLVHSWQSPDSFIPASMKSYQVPSAPPSLGCEELSHLLSPTEVIKLFLTPLGLPLLPIGDDGWPHSSVPLSGQAGWAEARSAGCARPGSFVRDSWLPSLPSSRRPVSRAQPVPRSGCSVGVCWDSAAWDGNIQGWGLWGDTARSWLPSAVWTQLMAPQPPASK